ncbi:MAG: hypothetical protein LBG19_00665 [Prevotellaceae bacterium]|jgi:hypothetical protein|nr:hypothetical protein [Prevotellaceae bacterium]
MDTAIVDKKVIYYTCNNKYRHIELSGTSTELKPLTILGMTKVNIIVK